MATDKLSLDPNRRERDPLELWQDYQEQRRSQGPKAARIETGQSRGAQGEQTADQNCAGGNRDTFQHEAPAAGGTGIYRPVSGEGGTVIQIDETAASGQGIAIEEPAEEEGKPLTPSAPEKADQDKKPEGGGEKKVITKVEPRCFCEGGSHDKYTGTNCYLEIVDARTEDGEPIPEMIGEKLPWKDEH